MYPGVTKTTPTLMASVLLEAHSKVLMMIKDKQCNNGIILNMEVINDLDVYTNTWRERWTFLACEEIVELLIKFKYLVLFQVHNFYKVLIILLFFFLMDINKGSVE